MNEPSSPQSPRPGRSTPLIFVVDDNPDLGELLQIFFRTVGYETRIFNDPLMAVSAMKWLEPKPDLLITDFRMPGINGMELIERCRKIHPGLKVISASANIPGEGTGSFTVKPDRLLPKPYSTTQLLRLVNDLLGK